MNLIELTNRHIKNSEYRQAVKLLEAILVIDPAMDSCRLELAKIYINLGTDSDKFSARNHLEYFLNGDCPSFLPEVVSLLFRRVYYTNGPFHKGVDLLNKYGHLLPKELLIEYQSMISDFLSCLDDERKSAKLPDSIGDLAVTDHVLTKFLFNSFKRDVHLKSVELGSFFTMGSCFASNVAREMSVRGINVNTLDIGEDVNTTFSNLSLIQYLLGFSIDNAAYYKKILMVNDIDTLRHQLINSKYLIYTMGVATGFFRDDDGVYVPHDSSNLLSLYRSNSTSYRFSKVDENVASLQETLKILRKHTRIQHVYLTVSPIPMVASLLSNSVLSDDMESKSILRAAAGITARNHADFCTYFPSYEVFRLLPCFQNSSAFGVDDGSVRHANQAYIRLVVERFIEIISNP